MVRWFGAAAGLLLVAGCGGGNDEASGTGNATAYAGAVDRACASQETYDRLKELLFDEAARIRGDGAEALDRVAPEAVARMEDVTVTERDVELNVITCEGRFVLELPPGSENAFDGERRVTADVRYAAQTADDGSGLVYQMEGAEPIIYRLATIGGLARADQQQSVTIPSASAPPGAPGREIETAEAAPTPTPTPPRTPQRPAPAAEPQKPAPRAAPPKPQQRASARPSFNCRVARSRSERMVCGSGALAALDRRMSAQFYSALSDAPPRTRAALRRSRDRFLAFRERCGSEACVAQAYRDRMDEIADIAAGE